MLLLAGYPGGVGALDLRQVCNAAYSAITQWMSSDDHKQFDRELLAPMRRDGTAVPVSRGTGALMAVMGVRPPARPPSKHPDAEGEA